MVLERMKEANLSGQQRTNNVRIVDAALVPSRPVKPRVMVDLMASAVLGLLLAVGLAFVREFLDTSVKTKEQVEDELGLPFLGIIPLVPGARCTAKSGIERSTSTSCPTRAARSPRPAAPSAPTSCSCRRSGPFGGCW